MIRRILTMLFFTIYCLLFTVCSSYADAISSNELIEKAREFDGKTITYKGEAVTAILNRGEYSWANLNDGYNAVGVWCKTATLNSVKFAGSYKYKGDILEVVGIFNRACHIHGGELDIHARDVNIVRSGYSIKDQIDIKRIYISIALFLTTLSII
ncbi:MAG: DNA-binding protein, partial [Candidatus Omnitrophota bacterium]|nr:DNA-binding protein [Candidatus Omnitrophota bacterium]